MSKNIVVLSDGTGQDGGRGHDTNVYKLFRMLEDRTPNQVVFYDQGLGTDWRKVTGNAFGAGFSKNILQCYRFIYDNYEAGDKIFLLGFSRGAATVRSLANFIHYFGILPKARPELIKRAWKLYRVGRQEGLGGADVKQGRLNRTLQFIDSKAFRRTSLNEKARDFVREHPNHWVDIEFLGVWDTVPALGIVPLAGLNLFINRIPWLKHQFHDFKLHESVNNGYHALAIDDDRLWFHPTVWKECNEKQQVQQVWFSGSHTDVGGGFMAGGLSDVSLEWMVEKAIMHGIRLYMRSRPNWNFVIAPDPTDRQHPPRAGFGVVFKKGVRDIVWDKKTFDSYGPPKIHQSVLDRMRHDKNYRPWIVDQVQQYLKLLPSKFDEYLRDEHAKGYDAVCETYNTALDNDQAAGLPDLPSREDWCKANPFEDWCRLHQPDYLKALSKGVSGAEWEKWLEDYAPYREWMTATYAPFTETEFGRLMIESDSEIYEFRDAKGQRCFTNKRIAEAEQNEKGYTDMKSLAFRDYDRGSLGAILEKTAHFAKSKPGDYDGLFYRGKLPKLIVAPQSPIYRNVFSALWSGLTGFARKKQKSTWDYRYDYDEKRWSN